MDFYRLDYVDHEERWAYFIYFNLYISFIFILYCQPTSLDDKSTLKDIGRHIKTGRNIVKSYNICSCYLKCHICTPPSSGWFLKTVSPKHIFLLRNSSLTDRCLNPQKMKVGMVRSRDRGSCEWDRMYEKKNKLKESRKKVKKI